MEGKVKRVGAALKANGRLDPFVEELEEKILEIRGQRVLLDRDVASIYGVQTKRINEAVKNNPNRFPAGYIIEVDKTTKQQLVENFDRFEKLKHTSVMPKAFTEKGLYMLATILTTDKAVETTINIVEAFTKLRTLTRTVAELSHGPKPDKQKSLMQKSGELMAEILDDGLTVTDAETIFELNFAVLKLKHTTKKKRP